MEVWKQYQEIINLGKKIVQEFNADQRRDMTLQWMAHYLAELMAKAEREESDIVKAELIKECAEVILSIWKKRAHFPGRTRLLSGLTEVLPVLKALQDHSDDLSWERFVSYENDQPWGKFMRSARLSIEEILKISLVANVIPEALTKEKEWLEHHKQLSEVERALINYLDRTLLQQNQYYELTTKGGKIAEREDGRSKTGKLISLLEDNIASLNQSLEKLKSSLNQSKDRSE
jgi:hypothetical protein